MSIFLAYDGSTGSDWISHYAVRLTSRHPSKQLTLIHVRDTTITTAELDKKAARIQRECQLTAVSGTLDVRAPRGTVAETLLEAIPAGGDSFLLCGTRTRGVRRGLLRGTVAEQLLRSEHCHVLAVRVVQPGVLGLPRRLLLPISGHPRSMRAGLPFLRMFEPDISHLHILYVQRIGSWRLRMVSHATVERLRRPGESYCQQIEEEIAAQFACEPGRMDASVVVSDNLPREIAIAANKTKSHLILLGLPTRNLIERSLYSDPVEQVLRDAACDVAIFRGLV